MKRKNSNSDAIPDSSRKQTKTSSMFGSGDFTITGSNFLNNEGSGTQNLIQSQTYIGQSGIQLLFNHIANEAAHDSHERYPPPNCYPGTREGILEQLKVWIEGSQTETRLLWLSGSVGVGKTAIMQNITELLLRPDGPVVASFFFGRGKGKRELGEYLFPTIAHQLTINIPELRGPINNILQYNPSLLTKALPLQLHSLITDPLLSIPNISPKVIIIDGLDECHDHLIQRLIIQLISEAIQNVNLPLRFIIASRPEPQITAAFDKASSRIQMRQVVLDDQTFQTSTDICKFLTDQFHDITNRSCYARLFLTVKMPWPGEDVIEQLVKKADGQFIYATTMIKFVDDNDFLPTKQLELILTHQYPSHTFSALDDLYTQILSAYPDKSALLDILGFTIILRDIDKVTPLDLGDLLGMSEVEVEAKLSRLHPVLDIKQHGAVSGFPEQMFIDFFHASFYDYLVDAERSGPFAINKKKFVGLLYINFLSRFSMKVIQIISSNSMPDDHDFQNSTPDMHMANRYSIRYLRSPEVEEFNAESIESLTSIATDFQHEWNVKSPLLDSPIAPRLYLLIILETLEKDYSLQYVMSPYEAALHHCLELTWLLPDALNQLVTFVPTIVAMPFKMSVHGAATYLGVDKDVLSPLVNQNLDLMRRRRSRAVAGISTEFSFHPGVLSFVENKLNTDACCSKCYHIELFKQHLDRIFPKQKSDFSSPLADLDITDLFFADRMDILDGVYEEACSEHVLGLLDHMKSVIYSLGIIKLSPDKVACLWLATRAMLHFLVVDSAVYESEDQAKAEFHSSLLETRKIAAKNIFDQVLILQEPVTSPTSRVVYICQPLQQYVVFYQELSISWPKGDCIKEFDGFLKNFQPEMPTTDSDIGQLLSVDKALLLLGSFMHCGFGDYLTSPDAGRFYISQEQLRAQVFQMIKQQTFKPEDLGITSGLVDDWEKMKYSKQARENLDSILRHYSQRELQQSSIYNVAPDA